MLRIVFCNCSPDESEELARELVAEDLAACVNILSGVRSVYEWEGEVCDEFEHTLLIKTSGERYPDVQSWIEEHHSYDVPEVVAVEAADVNEAYLEWVERQTTTEN